ncbi:hypothetical protein PHYC_01015 [Phycisphaerales bacterium]|nr:hypothetical protein PHYC_01015 [Phycisphaerales bacterium]
MPHVVNGIGTWYWGKRNISTRRDRCAQCGAVGDLRSYDTTLFIVVFFVPLIPLGGKRILDECPKCTRHSAASLAKWEKAKDEALEKSGAALLDDPDNHEKTIAAIGTTIAYHAKTEFLGVTGAIGPRALAHPDVQGILGDAYCAFGMFAEGEEAYRQCMSLKPCPATARVLAGHLLRHSTIEEARPFLDPLLAEGSPENIGVIYLIVIALQAAGRHEESLQILDAFAAKCPSVRDMKDYKSLHKTSSKNRTTGKAIKSALVHSGAPVEAERGWAFRGAKFIGPALALMILAGYLAAAFIGAKGRRVHLVNGLRREYTVQVDGSQPLKLYPGSPSTIALDEGDHLIQVIDLPGVGDVPITIRTSLWSRPFTNHLFVVNPDTMALVVWEEVTFVPVGSRRPAPPPNEKVHTGSAVHHFTGIDYPLQAVPSQISMSSSSSRVTKRSVIVTSTSAEDMVITLSGTVEPAAQFEWAKAGLRCDPSDERFTLMLRQFAPEQAIEVVRESLKVRPLLVHSHRLYQDMLEVIEPERDLGAEYRAILAENPGDSTGKYLCGRVTRDAAESERLYRGATEGSSPEPLAFRALAMLANGSGRFEEGLAILDIAAAANVADENCNSLRVESLEGLGRLEEALAIPPHNQSPEQISPANLLYTLILLGEAGRHDHAIAMIDALMSQVPADMTDSQAARSYFESRLLYAEGKIDEYLAAAERAGGSMTFSAHLTAGRVEEAAKLLQSGDSSEYSAGASEHLTLFIAATLGGQRSVADVSLQTAIGVLRKGDYEDRSLAAWLAGEGDSPAASQLAGLQMERYRKVLTLTALGLHREDVRSDAFSLVRKLNTLRLFPHHLIAQAISETN